MRFMKLLSVIFVSAVAALAQEQAIDWNKARDLHRRAQAGEKLSPEEQKYYDEARRQRAKGQAGPRADAPPKPPPNLVPLTELKGEYHGETGGLYGGGKNEPPPSHATRAARAVAEIKPLDRDGRPAADGKVVLMSIGMSNTTQEFSAFVQKAAAAPQKAAHVTVVDAAQGGMDGDSWSKADSRTWAVAEQRLGASGVSPAQVQAVWIKQALKGPRNGFPAETERLRDRLRDIVGIAKQKYPNLRAVYFSSRIYAGNAKSALNPEPYAYESAFAVRWLIEEQIKGGLKDAPVLLWGPYIWANGETPNKDGGLSYAPGDFAADGTHPGTPARAKVAAALLDFFTTSPFAKPWFAK